QDGWFYFADRHIDLIKRGGENISTTEVENILEEMPGIAEAAVVGVPDPVRDQAVKAVLVLTPGSNITEAEISAYAAANLASFKV
ncbi:long-chain fatty acid--CoA ligase, partial [Streptococcus agalactiae]|nr:long-chain fatty acid--CoA ligase [Streptococcus agalactiae]